MGKMMMGLGAGMVMGAAATMAVIKYMPKSKMKELKKAAVNLLDVNTK